MRLQGLWQARSDIIAVGIARNDELQKCQGKWPIDRRLPGYRGLSPGWHPSRLRSAVSACDQISDEKAEDTEARVLIGDVAALIGLSC